MAKKQTRRSVSVAGPTYDRLKAYCKTRDVSMSSIVERLIKCHTPSLPSPVTVPAAADPVEEVDKALGALDTVSDAVSKHFTF